MEANRPVEGEDDEGGLPTGFVLGGTQVHPLLAAAAIGGAVAAGAGAYLGARALARRNAPDGKVNSVLATAITASDVKHGADDKKS